MQREALFSADASLIHNHAELGDYIKQDLRLPISGVRQLMRQLSWLLCLLASMACDNSGTSVETSDARADTSQIGPYCGMFQRGAFRMSFESLLIEPNGRISLAYTGDVGGNAAIDIAATSIDNSILCLAFIPRTPTVEGRRDQCFLPVRWGKRLYLVEQDAGIEFCNTVNCGSEPRQESYGAFFLRQDDWMFPTTGLPDVPDRWRAMLLTAPVVASVTRVDVTDVTQSWIDAGRRAHVYEGLVLFTADRLPTDDEVVAHGGPVTRRESLTVVYVADAESKVRWRSVTEPNRSVPLGLVVTSRPTD